MPNGIDLILADHRRVDALFDAVRRDAATRTRRRPDLDMLTAHDDAEHAALYPLAGRAARRRPR